MSDENTQDPGAGVQTSGDVAPPAQPEQPAGDGDQGNVSTPETPKED